MLQADLATFIWIGGAVAFLIWFVGGFLCPVGGEWLENQRHIELTQFGPWVWGSTKVEGGIQRYSGKIWRRDLFLTRRDYGRGHLRNLGFSEVQIGAVEGRVMVRLRLTLQEDGLVGRLWGTRFQFRPGTREIVAVNSTAAEARHWTRV